jgi:hypothetical protein
VHAFALGSKEAEELHRVGVSSAKPVRDTGIKLGRFPRTDVKAQVLAAAAAGAWTAVVINNHLMAEELARDVAAHRESLAAAP